MFIQRKLWYHAEKSAWVPYTCQLADARANEISPELYKLYYLHRSNQIVKNLTAYKNGHAIVWVLLLEFGA